MKSNLLMTLLHQFVRTVPILIGRSCECKVLLKMNCAVKSHSIN